MPSNVLPRPGRGTHHRQSPTESRRQGGGKGSLKGKRLDPKFLFFILDRNPNLLAYDDGQTQTHLSKGNVLECPLCVPPTKSEQQRIANCLTSLDDLIAAETQKLETLKAHKKGLMQQLFPCPEGVEA